MSGVDVVDRTFWLRNCESIDACRKMGIVEVDRFNFALEAEGHQHLTYSMLHIYEVALLYSLTRDYYEGWGEIIDAGPLLGLSTFSLAKGLHENPRLSRKDKRQRIYSFDLFSMRGYEFFIPQHAGNSLTGSLLPEFIAVNKPYLDMIVINQGDFKSWPWPDRPVEIFFLDLSKSMELNDHAIRTYFPRLEVGSILVQQDYIHYQEYWIHLTMEIYKDHFEFCGSMYGATHYYRCIKKVNAADLIDIGAIPYAEKREIFERARSHADPLTAQVMKSAAAACALDNHLTDEAQDLLDSIDLTVSPSHFTLDVRDVVKSNRDLVQSFIDQSRAGR